MSKDLEIRMEAVSNPRKNAGWESDLHCAKCGTITNAFVSVEIIYNKCLIVHPFLLCKSCLFKGVDIIDQTVMRQCISKG